MTTTLSTLAESMKTAFGATVEIHEGEQKITIGGKTAWIDADGKLTPESGIGSAALEVGVNVVRAGVTAAGAAVS